MAKQYTDEELKKRLTPEQYRVLRQAGTEAPFSGELLHAKGQGVYKCPVCGSTLFTSEQKYDSDTPGLAGWPSFFDVASSDAVKLKDDDSMGMHRTEVVCATWGICLTTLPAPTASITASTPPLWILALEKSNTATA
jgi:peptide-methionine (R)-S-oxide reductase